MRLVDCLVMTNLCFLYFYNVDILSNYVCSTLVNIVKGLQESPVHNKRQRIGGEVGQKKLNSIKICILGPNAIQITN